MESLDRLCCEGSQHIEEKEEALKISGELVCYIFDWIRIFAGERTVQLRVFLFLDYENFTIKQDTI